MFILTETLASPVMEPLGNCGSIWEVQCLGPCGVGVAKGFSHLEEQGRGGSEVIYSLEMAFQTVFQGSLSYAVL